MRWRSLGSKGGAERPPKGGALSLRAGWDGMEGGVPRARLVPRRVGVGLWELCAAHGRQNVVSTHIGWGRGRCVPLTAAKMWSLHI